MVIGGSGGGVVRAGAGVGALLLDAPPQLARRTTTGSAKPR